MNNNKAKCAAQPLRTGPLIVDGKFVSQRKEASSMSNQRSHLGANLDVLRSLGQKALRRSDRKTAMLALAEIADFGFRAYACKVPLVCAIEDCADPMAAVQVNAVFESAKTFTNNFHASKAAWVNLFLAKMVCIVAEAEKSWRSHALAMFAERHRKQVDRGAIKPMDIPEYSLDVHCATGRARGATISGFWDEHGCLSPLRANDRQDEFVESVFGDDEAL